MIAWIVAASLLLMGSPKYQARAWGSQGFAWCWRHTVVEADTMRFALHHPDPEVRARAQSIYDSSAMPSGCLYPSDDYVPMLRRLHLCLEHHALDGYGHYAVVLALLPE